MSKIARYHGSLSRGRFVLVSALLFAAAPLSCQVLSGLDDLEATGAPGSSSSASSSSSSSSTGGALCPPNQAQACYSGPPGTDVIGTCKAGTQTCASDGSSWGPCAGEVTPMAFENCADEKDRDCDGALPSLCQGALQQAFVYGSTLEDSGQSIAFDSQGNVIVVGWYTGPFSLGSVTLPSAQDGGNDGFVVKLNPSGAVIWAQSYVGAGHTAPTGVAIGKDDSIGLIGAFANTFMLGPIALSSKGSTDIFLAKLDKDGTPVWANSFGDAGADQGYGIALDEKGNLFVTGSYGGAFAFGATMLPAPAINDDGWVAKVDASGNPLWAHAFSGAGYENGFGITTDSEGDVVVTGRGSGDITIGQSIIAGVSNGAFVSKLDGDSGAVLWGKVFGPGTVDPNQLVYDVARGGPNGEVVIAGHFQVEIQFPPNLSLKAVEGLDIFLAKLDKDGNAIWSQAFGDAGTDAVFELDVDVFDNIVIGGFFSTSLTFPTESFASAGGNDAFVAKFRPDGSHLWAATIGGALNDNVNGVAVAPDGTSVLTGRIEGTVAVNGMMFTSAGAGDLLFAKLAP